MNPSNDPRIPRTHCTLADGRDGLDVFDFLAISEEGVQRLNRCSERYSSLGTLPYI